MLKAINLERADNGWVAIVLIRDEDAGKGQNDMNDSPLSLLWSGNTQRWKEVKKVFLSTHDLCNFLLHMELKEKAR